MAVNNNGYILNTNTVPVVQQQQRPFAMPVVSIPVRQAQAPAYTPVDYRFVPVLQGQTVSQPNISAQKSLIDKLIEANSTAAVEKIQETPKTENVKWKNDLKQVFKENKAVIYAMIPRTFNAKDKDGDALIDLDKGEELGTFLNAIDRLD